MGASRMRAEGVGDIEKSSPQHSAAWALLSED